MSVYPAHAYTEQQLVNTILARYEWVPEVFLWRANSGAFPVGDGKAKRWFRANIKGCADIVGCAKGVFVGLECKRPGNKKHEDSQKLFQDKVSRAGGVYRVVRTLEEAERAIEEASQCRESA